MDHSAGLVQNTDEGQEILVQSKGAALLAKFQARIMEMVLGDASLSDVLSTICTWLEREGISDGLASVVLIDEAGKLILTANSEKGPYLGERIVDAGVEFFNRSLHLKQLLVTTELSSDPLWKQHILSDLPEKYNACCCIPILLKGRNVAGFLALFFHSTGSPEKPLTELLEFVAQTTSMVLEFNKLKTARIEVVSEESLAFEKSQVENRSLYRLLMEAPAMIAVLKGPQHTYEFANPLYFEVVGRRHEIIGKPVRRALPELAGQGIYELLDEVYQTGIPYTNSELPIRLDRKGNGTLDDIYFNFIFQPIHNDSGFVEGVFVHAVDITDYVAARKQARESEDRFRSFVMSSPSPIGIYVGKEMRIQTVNEAILKAWEKDDSIVGKTFREALPELEGQPFYQLLDDVYTTGIPYQATEARVDLLRNGRLETTYFNFNYKALKDANGQIYGVINTGTEVTDLVLAKQKLANTEESLRTAIDIAELGTWHLDLNNQHIWCSPRVLEWFGLGSEIETMDAVVSCIIEEDRKRITSEIEKAIHITGNYEAEYRVVNRTSGLERVLHAKGKLLYNEKGEPFQLSGTVRDVTMQKMTEQELEKQVELRTSELHRANVELGNVNQNLKQFAYVASHDLQEPLRKINMFSDILQQRHKMDFDNIGRMHLQKIAQAASRMTNLIRDLLDFSRVDSRESIMVDTNLNEVLNNIKTDYELLIHQKEATLKIDQLFHVEAAPLQMNQLFYNIVGNALKFSRPDLPPQIHIRSRIMDREEVLNYPELNAKWSYCEIVVEDNGIGFDQNFAEQIFTIFQRLHGRSEYEGTGIGLAVCKKIIENHQGRIFAKSVEGIGSSFYIILPLKRQNN